jgi:hypothetical protein
MEGASWVSGSVCATASMEKALMSVAIRAADFNMAGGE